MFAQGARRGSRAEASERRRQSRRARSKRVGAARRAAPRATEIALADLAHDIRTPLTGILALSELLLASELAERERRWAAAMKDAAAHLARLTTLVVDAAKAGGRRVGAATRSRSRCAIWWTRWRSRSTARAEGKALGVKVSVAKNLPARVIGDALRLRSALENLIDNAVKFTERGGVALDGHGGAGAARPAAADFAVTDTGIGIVAAELKRLFRPFAQANEDVARRYGGAGLGLAFVKRIAAAMGGDLAVTSRPGRGSTFRLTRHGRARGAGAKSPRRRAARPRALARAVRRGQSLWPRRAQHRARRTWPSRHFAGSGEAAVERSRAAATTRC